MRYNIGIHVNMKNVYFIPILPSQLAPVFSSLQWNGGRCPVSFPSGYYLFMIEWWHFCKVIEHLKWWDTCASPWHCHTPPESGNYSHSSKGAEKAKIYLAKPFVSLFLLFFFLYFCICLYFCVNLPLSFPSCSHHLITLESNCITLHFTGHLVPSRTASSACQRRNG